ncbi:hypothetical protein NL533_30810, partial [Klebsiella pneumoniae]|nr:hypothetical protein [Klebsiella pneumoniae]
YRIPLDIFFSYAYNTNNNTDKSVDEEEYMLFRMNREKMVGENLRDGNMEVAFELWIEQKYNF